MTIRVNRGNRISSLLAEASRRACRVFGLEELEKRQLMSSSAVININNSGAGSLRQAIIDANADAAPDIISFHIPAVLIVGGVATISPTTALPAITQPLTIDGTTQTTFGGNTNASGPEVVIKGFSAGAPDGFQITNTNNTTIRGLVIQSFGGNGISVSNSTGVAIDGNYIGTNAAGTSFTGFANTKDGVLVTNSSNVTVGGLTSAERNLISGNGGNGIEFATTSLANPGTGNMVKGNWIGLNATGSAVLRNSAAGVLVGSTIAGAGSVTIGGAAANVISGNSGGGIKIIGVSGNIVTGNFIGTNPAGNASGFGNNGDGVNIQESAVLGQAKNNQIGGPNAADRNVISKNTANGVHLILASASTGNMAQGNYIGTDVTGMAALGNQGDGVKVDSNGSGGGHVSVKNNVLSANAFGAELPSSNNTFYGNLIGTKADGTASLGNVVGGIIVDGDNNTIGGIGSGQPNTIAYNVGSGVSIDIGTGNSIRGNSIHDNHDAFNPSIGIDLIDSSFMGVTLNDSQGHAAGTPNLFQNFPIISSASDAGSAVAIVGSLASTGAAPFALDFYANNTADPSGYGQGKIYLGSISTSGGAFTTPAFSLSAGSYYISATATDNAGNTSEFSQDQFVNISAVASQSTPSFSGLSSKTSTYGNASVTFTGGISGTAGVPTGSVSITVSNAITLFSATQFATINSITGAFTTTFVTNALPVNSYVVTYSYPGDTNYFPISNNSTTLTVNKAHLTVTADNTSKVYGAAVPALTATVTGFLNGENSSVISGSAALSTTATASSHVAGNTFSISAALGTLSAANYDFTFVGGALTVTPATLTITANNATKVYGAALPVLSASYSGFVNSDTSASLTTQPTVATSGTIASHVGSYPIAASGAVDSDYTIGYVAGTLTVTPAALTITANNASKLYGAALPTLSVSYSGFVNGDTSASLTTLPTVTTTATAASHFGSYAITASGAADSDYTIGYVGGTLSVTPAALQVFASQKFMTYGGTFPTLTAFFIGLVNGDTAAAVPVNLTTNATPTSHVGTYTITVSGATNPDYTYTYFNENLFITTAALTITADNKVMTYGGSFPTLTKTYTGLVNGDTPATVPVNVTTVATPTSNVGIYAINVSGAADSDYTYTYVSGTLTINKATLTPSIAAFDKVYDGTTTATLSSQSVSGLIGSDVVNLTVTAANFDTANVGVGKLVTATGLGLSGAAAGNYILSSSTATTNANITVRALTVTADPETKIYGDSDPALTYQVTSGSLVISDAFSGVLTRDASENVGSHTIHQGSLTAGGNYAITFVIADLSITQRSIHIAADPKSKTYGDADPALTYHFVSGSLAFSDSFMGGLTRVAGENVGSYAIQQGSLAIGSNYALTIDESNLNISARAITVTAAANTKTYDGTTSASAVPTITLGSLAFSDTAMFTETYDTKNVGMGKVLTPTGSISDGNGGLNYSLTFVAAATGEIDALAINGSITALNKVYDSTTAATIATRTLTGVLGSDVVSYTGGTATFADKNVGTGKLVTATGLGLSGADAGNYTVNSTATTNADIAALAIVGNITVFGKIYDGTTAATINTRTLTGVLGSDDVMYVGGTANFNDKNHGIGKPVTATGLSLSGADAGNYTVNATATTASEIDARALVGSITANNKVYDGTNVATISGYSLSNVVSGEDVTYAGGTATFDNKNVGTGKAVSAIGLSLTGADIANYTVNTTASTTADITARALVVTATGVNKVYDGNNTATVTLSDNRLAGDVFTDSYSSALFADKNVGTGKAVSVSGISISGTDAGNYTFNTTASTTADITARALVVTATGVNKVYDGNNTATVTLSDNRLAGDVFTDSYSSALFADKNVGTGKAVSVSGISISGTDANNYTFNTTASTTANISARGLLVTATGVDKVYDGNNTATVTLADNRLAGDVFTDSYGSASFADKNVGTGKSVSVSGISITGADAGNYSVNTTVTTTANITPFALTGSITANNKIYDGTVAATIATRTLSGVLGSDVVSYVGGTATFADKNVGAGKLVTATGLSLTGADSGNYTVNSTATTNADITALAITGNITASNKGYDGTSAVAIASHTLNGVLGTDVVSYVGGTATFADKNVGSGKLVTATGLSLTGVDSGNYTVNSTAMTNADITKLGIIGSITANDKTYDSTIAATIASRSLSGVLGSDVVSYVGGTATFANKNVGTGKLVTATGLSLSGADAGNYSVNTTATANANITPFAITGSITANDKIYDSTTAATIATRTLAGVFAGDSVSYSGGTAVFSDKNVGTGKAVSGSGLSLTGTDAANYTVNTTANTTPSITARAITVSADAKTKVFGNVDPALTYQLTSGSLVGGDIITGSLPRTAGESVGAYPILQGTLTAGSNYAISYVGANLTITAAASGSSLSGFVYVDANANETKDSGEAGLNNVLITLTNSSGQVIATTHTDSSGAYSFNNLSPGTYVITQTLPSYYLDNAENVGSLGGVSSPGGAPQISAIPVGVNQNGVNYNFGDVALENVATGDSATIGFWHNKNGQTLIKALNGSSTSHNLANWLSTNFANIYGSSAGANSLVGKTNADVAAVFNTLFNVTGQKLDAQVMAVGLAMYVTNQGLAGTTAVGYGFDVNTDGTAGDGYNIGSSGAAFGVANNSVMTVRNIMDACNLQAVNGVLYGGNTSLRNMANTVFNGINTQGDIM